ncbi:maleylacetoacetate isomerase [Yunchengibacter salinarum]|uniref:maleylacetoacetate isomerase n=1 Tax=Yunchengibacter salinarum TaxID=3133399 RepID=UPI0035B69E6B
MKLYGYFRSSAAYRVRIALNLKGIEAHHVPVNLKPGEDGQKTPDYRAINPQMRVPTLVDGDLVLGQSPAILEYLEENWPDPPLLPAKGADRAWVRQIAAVVGCDIHPLNNLSVLTYLKGSLGADGTAVTDWYQHWIHTGFQALEMMLANSPLTGTFCYGETPGMADLYLVPQIWNARRFETPLDDYPTLRRIDEACAELPAFRRAAPEAQADAPR